MFGGIGNMISNRFLVAVGDVAEAGVRTAKNHPKGVAGLGFGINVAIQSGIAKKGKFVEDSGTTVASEAGSIIGGIVGGLTPIPGGGILGSLIGYSIGGTLARTPLAKAMEYGKTINHISVGGHYRDTEMAYTMRQRASQELSGSLLNARMYLGQEGNLYHT
jgi:hypothetical protein